MTRPHVHVRAAMAGVLATAALIAVVSLGPVWSSALAATPANTETITIQWRYTFQEHQASPPAVSSGDTLQATFMFTGKQTGSGDFVCIAAGEHFLCQGVVRLGGGDLYVGCCPLDETKTAAILGGTGEFVGATGQFTQTFTSADTGSWTIQLQRRRDT